MVIVPTMFSSHPAEDETLLCSETSLLNIRNKMHAEQSLIELGRAA